MNILLSGGTGFIGTALVEQLIEYGHQVIILSRQTLSDYGSCRYVGDLDDIRADQPIDAIVNLAGASMADKRWSLQYKQELFASRVETTRARVPDAVWCSTGSGGRCHERYGAAIQNGRSQLDGCW